MSSPLSAFTAVPNPQMLAFMGTQSFIMMYQAGEGWQYGKRKQSAMSNEEFNKQTPLSIMDRQRTELINALPSIKDSMNAMTPLINTIVTQYGDFLNEIIKATPETIKNATTGINLPGFPLAFGSSGATTQKQFQAQTTNWGPLIEALAKWLTGGPIINMVGSGNVGTNVPTGGPIQGPGTFNTPTNTFQNIQEMVKAGTATQYTGPPNPPQPLTPSQQSKENIIESGLSPLATNAVNQFKTNIDNQIKVVADLSAGITALGIQLKTSPAGAQGKAKTMEKAMAKLNAEVAKLSALRIKFQATYGYYY